MRKLAIIVLLLLGWFGWCTASTNLNKATQTASQYIGLITVVLTPGITPPGGQPTWGPVLLPNDGSESVSMSITVPTGVPAPTNFTVMINDRCMSNGGVCVTSLPQSFTCTGPGAFLLSVSASNYGVVPREVLCLPPSQLPQNNTSGVIQSQ